MDGMNANHQFSLALIPHRVDDTLVEQRTVDGYINATAMCQAVGKLFADYQRLATTQAYLGELSTDMGIPISQLIQSVKGGSGSQGTWVHPDVAIHLAQWLSPKFAVAVSKWVREWLSGGRYAGGAMPYHLQRYTANQGKVPYTHFSVLNELALNLIAPLEKQGYTIPEHMVPDISQGKMFAKWLRDEKGVDTSTMPCYDHEYADGREVQARLYPIELLEDFRRHFNEVWLPTRSVSYFKDRDPAALPFLDKLLLPAPAPKPPTPQRRFPVKKAAKKRGL
ncbi:hypothetical protein ABIE09_001181 [Lysobacter enzymogenes]